MVNLPTYNPNSLTGAIPDTRRNRAVTDWSSRVRR